MYGPDPHSRVVWVLQFHDRIYILEHKVQSREGKRPGSSGSIAATVTIGTETFTFALQAAPQAGTACSIAVGTLKGDFLLLGGEDGETVKASKRKLKSKRKKEEAAEAAAAAEADAERPSIVPEQPKAEAASPTVEAPAPVPAGGEDKGAKEKEPAAEEAQAAAKEGKDESSGGTAADAGVVPEAPAVEAEAAKVAAADEAASPAEEGDAVDGVGSVTAVAAEAEGKE